jgi:hypothetical protein
MSAPCAVTFGANRAVVGGALTARTSPLTLTVEVSMDLFEWLLKFWQDDWLAPS